MSVLQRILSFLAPTQTAPPGRPPALLVEVLADRGRFEQELAALRAAVESSDARGSAAQAAFEAQLASAATAIKEELERTRGQLAEPIAGLAREVGKLSREQFQATTLLEGQGATLDELAEAWQEHRGQYERETEQLRQALADRDTQLRLGFVTQLLPVADALAESIRAARELVDGTRATPPPERASRLSPLVARLLGGPGAPPPLAGPSAAALESWRQGLLLVERRLLGFLEREGVRPIPSIGQTFDPHRHLAIAVGQDRGVPDGTVVNEERRGYSFGERVLRPAEVVVARRENGEP